MSTMPTAAAMAGFFATVQSKALAVGARSAAAGAVTARVGQSLYANWFLSMGSQERECRALCRGRRRVATATIALLGHALLEQGNADLPDAAAGLVEERG
jgi:hypothetical protein